MSSSSGAPPETHLQVGVVGRPHGIHGELKVRPHFEGSDALESAHSVVLVDAKGVARRFEIERVRGTRREPILDLVGVEGREAAEALRGSLVWVERSALPALDEDEYYLVDLVGCEVTCQGELVGVVEAVRPDPSVDTMVLRTPEDRLIEQPIVDAFIAEVNVKECRVELHSLEGIVD